MDPYLSIKVRFPPEDQPQVEPLAAFLLAFIQALLKTGYYQSSHPGSTAAKLGLYQQWLRLGMKEKEISVITGETGEEMVIYGALSEAVSLQRLFLPSVAEIFIPKFRQYFERRHLISFTLKSGITREEFEGFVDLMTDVSDPVAYPTVSEMAQKLADDKIVHVSVVYVEDAPLVERPMHWMARIALTRLGKDLRMIPLYKHLTPEQVNAMKTQTLREIVRPLSNWTVLKDVMVHCDILRIPNKGDDLQPIEEALYQGLTPDQALGLLLESARALETISHAEGAQTMAASLYEQRLVFIIRRVLFNFPEEKAKGLTEDLLEMLLAKGILVLDELPPLLVDAILIKRKTEDYLEHKHNYWERLIGGWPTEAQSFIAILSVLLTRDDFSRFGELLERLHSAFVKTFGRETEFFKSPGMEPVEAMMLKKLQARRMVQRKEALCALEPFAPIIAPCLFPLCAHEDLWLRRNICRILAGVGASLLPGLIAFAEEHKPWTVIRNVVMILGDMGVANEAVIRFLKRCQHHPHIRVGEEVMNSYGKIRGHDTETILLDMLKAPENPFHSRAVLALAHHNTASESYRVYLQEALRKKQNHETESEAAIQVACCLALEALIPLHPEWLDFFEPLLCHAVTHRKSFLPWLQKDLEKEDEVQHALFHLLGIVGTSRALPVLYACLEKDKGNDRIQEAIQKIEQRYPSP